VSSASMSRKVTGDALVPRRREELLLEVADAPVFRPTQEEFSQPLRYIEKIAPAAAAYGICKIVPPVNVGTPGTKVLKEKGFRFETSTQTLRSPMIAFNRSGRTYTLRTFESVAREYTTKRFGCGAVPPPNCVEREFWNELAAPSDVSSVIEYASDVEGNAFSDRADDPLGCTDWNLRLFPRAPRSTLRLVDGEITGVTSPLLYVGMLFSTFAWHVEDHFLYSINFHHAGAPKTWYGVPSKDADRFETVAQGVLGRSSRTDAPAKLMSKNVMFSPTLLLQHGVAVCRAVQMPGEYVVTFPRGYHGGFSHGFNLGEAVNFAVGDWFAQGDVARAVYRRIRRPPLLQHEALLIKEAELLAKRWRCRSRRRRRRAQEGQEDDDDASPSPPSSSSSDVDDEGSADGSGGGSTDACVRDAFTALVEDQLERRSALLRAGARLCELPGFSISPSCYACSDFSPLHMVTCMCSPGPVCLSSACLSAACACGHARTVWAHAKFERFRRLFADADQGDDEDDGEPTPAPAPAPEARREEETAQAPARKPAIVVRIRSGTPSAATAPALAPPAPVVGSKRAVPDTPRQPRAPSYIEPA